MNTGNFRFALAAAAVAVALSVRPARADLVLTLSDPFSGSYSAFAQEAGTIDISTVSADEVLVTVTSTNVSSIQTAYPNQSIEGVALNFGGTGSLSVSNYKVNGSTAAAPSNVFTNQEVDQSGAYSLVLETFAEGEVKPGQTLTFDVSDTSGLTPSSFDYASVDAGNGDSDGLHDAAIDFLANATGPGGPNEWVGTAPDGGNTLCLLGLAILGLACVHRKFLAC
jgi:hypothetical protein